MAGAIDQIGDLVDLLPPRAERVVVDGGCFRGSFITEIRSRLPTATIHAFEPDPDSHAILAERFERNDNVKLRNAALGQQLGQREFYRGSFPATNSLLPRPVGKHHAYYPQAASLEPGTTVAVEFIDGLMQTQGIDQIDVLKLDLQGGERDALYGADKALSEGRIALVYCEVVFVAKYEKQPLFWNICEQLAVHDYSLYAVHDVKLGLYGQDTHGPIDGQWNQADAIFLSPALRTRIEEGAIIENSPHQ